MSMLGRSVVGARVVDLFAGSGALGLEALSRGAREAIFVERSGPVLETLRENIEELGAGDDEVAVIRADAVDYADDLEEGAFDLALADPPYGHGLARRLFEIHADRAFARELWVEHASDDPLPEDPDLRSRPYGDTTLSRRRADR